MRDGFSAKVLDVLKDPLNLPQEFLDFLVQHQAVNGLPVPIQNRSTTIDYGTKTSNVTTTGTTFAAGTDILASALGFTASGSNSYLLRVFLPSWSNSASGNQNFLYLNLNGLNLGIFGQYTAAAANQAIPVTSVGLIATPSVGSHTVNARLVTSAGTATIQAGAGGAGVVMPLVVAVTAI